MQFWPVMLLLALSATAFAKSEELALPAVVSGKEIEGCELKQVVSGKSGWGGAAAELGIRNARKAALKKAAKAGATHVVWTGVSQNFLLSVTGRAYDCRNQAANKERIARDLQNAEQEKREAATALLELERKAEATHVASLNVGGPLRAYPLLAAYRYRKCASVADKYLQVEVTEDPDRFAQGLESIRQCAEEQEGLLKVEVRAALSAAPKELADLIKDLHAFSIASLRALTNFHQSVIEARQDRSQRTAAIDERATRLDLEM